MVGLGSFVVLVPMSASWGLLRSCNTPYSKYTKKYRFSKVSGATDWSQLWNVIRITLHQSAWSMSQHTFRSQSWTAVNQYWPSVHLWARKFQSSVVNDGRLVCTINWITVHQSTPSRIRTTLKLGVFWPFPC